MPAREEQNDGGRRGPGGTSGLKGSVHSRCQDPVRISGRFGRNRGLPEPSTPRQVRVRSGCGQGRGSDSMCGHDPAHGTDTLRHAKVRACHPGGPHGWNDFSAPPRTGRSASSDYPGPGMPGPGSDQPAGTRRSGHAGRQRTRGEQRRGSRRWDVRRHRVHAAGGDRLRVRGRGDHVRSRPDGHRHENAQPGVKRPVDRQEPHHHRTGCQQGDHQSARLPDVWPRCSAYRRGRFRSRDSASPTATTTMAAASSSAPGRRSRSTRAPSP